MSNPRAGSSAARFHDGEHAVHERYGIRERIDQVGRAVIRDAMPAQHRDFFHHQAMMFVGSLDAERRPWASLLVGPPGFVDTPDDRTLSIRARPSAGDPLAVHLAEGQPLGMIGIEFATRRRNRVNGTVIASDGAGFTVAVDQSFGNCPQYIQARVGTWTASELSGNGSARRLGGRLGGAALAIVGRSDTMFLASAAASARGRAGAEGVDVSHRGGLPGFVRVTEDVSSGRSVLTIPDFRGNFLFNTVGNLVSHPRAGLLFVDFASGDLLQLTGTTEIAWEGAEVEAFAGAQRLVKVTVEEGVLHPAALRATWSAPQFASQLEGTGSWTETAG